MFPFQKRKRIGLMQTEKDTSKISTNTIQVKALINFYKQWLGFENYYERIISNVKSNPNQFNQSNRFLEGIEAKEGLLFDEVSTENGDSRIDVPVWFGRTDNAQNRIIVFGLEPRDTNRMFNIEKVNKYVYGSPFGVDRWNYMSSVPYKPQNRYYRVFKELAEHADTFLLFSDLVKFYKVVDRLNTNRINDVCARKTFTQNAEKSKEKLIEEIKLVAPTNILLLGKDTSGIFKKMFPELLKITCDIRHPANKGETKAKGKIHQLLTKLCKGGNVSEMEMSFV